MINSIGVVGGGPGGLFFATLIKSRRPELAVTVYERNPQGVTFGFGVVFSDATLNKIHAADPVVRTALAEHGEHWDAIEVRLKGQRISCAGNGMAAIARKTLLQILTRHAIDAGVEIRHSSEIGPDSPELVDHDLIVAADGANSAFRTALDEQLEPQVTEATAKFIWFGTDYLFDGLTFVHEQSEHGTFAVHGYPISPEVSTFIVETDEPTWRAAGLDEFDASQPPGISDEKSRAFLEALFAKQIDGGTLLVNNSRWGNFRTRSARRWHHGNTVLLGDAVHTAHFSVGSGTKMAMEDAIALADAVIAEPDDLESALTTYEQVRQPSVARIQSSARPSLSWWENFGLYHESLEPEQFAFHFLSRSIGKANLARRDSAFVDQVIADWRARHDGADPLQTPLEIGGHRLPGRLHDLCATLQGAELDTPAGVLPLTGTPAGAPLRLIHGKGGWIAAPASEAELAATFDAVASAERPTLAGIHGGTELTRSLLSEQIRLRLGVPTLLAEPGDPEIVDRAETLILSGRADLVGVVGEAS